MIVLYDTEARRIVRAGPLRLEGECRRCGKCCILADPGCRHLSFDEEMLATCDLHGDQKPVVCAIWPLPFTQPSQHLPDGCGYRWES